MSEKGFIRRVVTGHDENGKAIVLSDDLTPTLKTNPLRPGHRSTEVRRTSATPARIAPAEADPTVDGPRTIHPQPRGTVIRIAEAVPDPVRAAGRRVRRRPQAALFKT